MRALGTLLPHFTTPIIYFPPFSLFLPGLLIVWFPTIRSKAHGTSTHREVLGNFLKNKEIKVPQSWTYSMFLQENPHLGCIL